MIRIAYVSIQDMTEDEYKSLQLYNSEARRLRLLQYSRIEDRYRGAAAGALLRLLLAEETGKSPMRFVFQREKNGKPYQITDENIDFNISHSGKFAAVAVSDSPIGIDVQTVAVNSERLYKTVLSEREAKAIAAEEEKTISQLFTRFWCRKEAFLKMQGTGLQNRLNELDTFSFETDKYPVRLYEYEPGPDAYLAVCSSNPEEKRRPEPEIYTVGNLLKKLKLQSL